MSEQPLDCAVVQFCQERIAAWEESNHTELTKSAAYDAFEEVIEFIKDYNPKPPETI